MKKIVILILFLFTVTQNIFAQQHDPMAEEILNKISQKYKAYKTYKATYTRSVENAGGDVYDTQNGEITVKGQKFNIKLQDQEIICNGTTLWSYMKDANEVNVSDYEPGADEITPTEIYNMYRKGYKYVMMSELKDKGQTLQTIDLEPENRKSEVAKVRLIVNKADKSVKKWIVFERGTNNRHVFEINKFVPNAPVKEDMFSFDKNKYKNVKVVELR